LDDKCLFIFLLQYLFISISKYLEQKCLVCNATICDVTSSTTSHSIVTSQLKQRRFNITLKQLRCFLKCLQILRTFCTILAQVKRTMGLNRWKGYFWIETCVNISPSFPFPISPVFKLWTSNQ